AHFRVRIDMRQIGVRDEARMVGGLGHCGQELCCKRLGGEFCPVSIRMAKEQDLSLNPQKISGVCGRLMCCLRYEFDAYKEFKERAPKINATIDTPEGAARVVDLNIPLEIVTIKLSSDKTVKIPLAKMEADEKGTRPNKIGKKVFDEYANQTILDSFGSPTFSPFGDKSLTDGPLKKERLGEDGGAGSARKEQDTLSSRKPRRRTRSGKAQEAPDVQGESRAQGTTRSNNQAKKSANQKNQGKNAKDQGQAKRRRGKNSEDASSKNGSQGQKRGRPSRQGQGANTSEAGAGTRSTGPRPGQKSSGLRTGEQRSFTEPRKAPTRTRKDSGEAQDSGEYRRSRRRTHTSGGEKSGETE
ncbi:MAG: hypothetical protein LBB35_02800, partial [Coriobacteriaceae bacterium]|nr:hypothetical protein [Coriobacteriaceae bacterium]